MPPRTVVSGDTSNAHVGSFVTAVLFGSISTLADTSEMQRQAFNKAFQAHGLTWEWSQSEYRSLLSRNGGAQRIGDYASGQGVTVDADAVHTTKSTIFRESLGAATVRPRPGVLETITHARAKGHKVALVTTTSKGNVAALLSSLRGLDAEDFDVIVDATDIDKPKPDAAAYLYALDLLGVPAAACVAIEDNPGGVAAARAAGVACVAFPNVNTAGQDFSAAQQQTDAIDLALLEQLIAQD